MFEYDDSEESNFEQFWCAAKECKMPTLKIGDLSISAFCLKHDKENREAIKRL